MFFHFDVAAALKRYHEALKDEEIYYINPPTKTMLKNLLLIWSILFVTFLLSVNGLQSIFIIIWIPVLVLLYFYSNLWTKVGLSLIIYWAMNVIAIVGSYFISRWIHFIIKLIGVI